MPEGKTKKENKEMMDLFENSTVVEMCKKLEAVDDLAKLVTDYTHQELCERGIPIHNELPAIIDAQRDEELNQACPDITCYEVGGNIYKRIDEAEKAKEFLNKTIRYESYCIGRNYGGPKGLRRSKPIEITIESYFSEENYCSSQVSESKDYSERRREADSRELAVEKWKEWSNKVSSCRQGIADKVNQCLLVNQKIKLFGKSFKDYINITGDKETAFECMQKSGFLDSVNEHINHEEVEAFQLFDNMDQVESAYYEIFPSVEPCIETFNPLAEPFKVGDNPIALDTAVSEGDF